MKKECSMTMCLRGRGLVLFFFAEGFKHARKDKRKAKSLEGCATLLVHNDLTKLLAWYS